MKAWALFKLGRLEQAEQVLTAAVARLEDAVMLDHLGDILLARGKAAHEYELPWCAGSRMRVVQRIAAGLAVLLVLAPAVARAQARALRWKSMAVDARLESSGALLVTERHHIVFDGPWNGGERPFRAGAARPELIALTRVDPRTNRSYPLSPARTAQMEMDQYAWAGSNLRWRARRASDPPFRNYESIYVVQYRLTDVVRPDGDRYLINHDFAFTGRPGVIERFTLALAFDPPWERAPGIALPLERANLAPQQTVTLRFALKWTGTGRPRHVGAAAAPAVASQPAAPLPPPPPPATSADKAAVLLLFAVLAGLLVVWFLRRETAAGAFGQPPEITPQWLEGNVFRHRPEVLGAAWDGETGHAEAAALIAILIAEGKVENIPGAPGRSTMFGTRDSGAPRLKLLVPRDGLVEYERAFVDRLFVNGDEIDPDTLKQHYAASGFNPADAIRAPLAEAAEELVGKGAPPGVGLGFLAAVLIVVLGLPVTGLLMLQGDELLPFFTGAVLFTASIGLAGLYRSERKSRLLAVAIALPMLVMAAVLVVRLTNVKALEVFLGLTLLLLVLSFRTARTIRTLRDQENLRALRAARTFFKRRLRNRNADVEDRWVPYLLAFGLGKDLDRWAVAAPPREPVRDREWTNDSTSASAGRPAALDPGPSFRGGGGAFGGGGATGTWASSIASFAAAVPAPPSSSDSGGSSSDWSSSSSDSSSGSDSGGGSGGGW